MIRDFALRKDPRQHVPAHAQHLSRCWQHLTASLGCWHCIHRDYGWAVGDAVNGQHDELRPTRPSTLLHHCLKLGMQTIVLVMHMRCGTGVRMRSDLRHTVGGTHGCMLDCPRFGHASRIPGGASWCQVCTAWFGEWDICAIARLNG